MADLTALTDLDLVRATLAAERELLSARFKRHQGKLENSASLKGIRKRIARMKTELRAREMGTGARKGSLAEQHLAEARQSEVSAPAAETAGGGGFLKGIVDKLTGPA